MARINTNVGAITTQRHLNKAYASLSETIQRLASGLRINRGADDPAGLIVSERLRTEVEAVNQAILNTQRASNIIATTEGALNEVARLLTDIQDLIVGAANEGAFSDDEIQANQLQVDSAIASITRIANTTTFAGRHLLNGSLDYITSGVNNAQIDALAINGVQFGTQSYIPVNIEVTTSAQLAQLFFANGTVAADVTIEVAGNLGVTTLNFAATTSAAQMVQAINLVSDATGVSATLSSNPTSGFTMSSQFLGSKQFVSIQALPGGGSFDVQDADGITTNRDIGRDAVGLVNGAQSMGDGNSLTFKTAVLDMQVTLNRSFGLGSTSFAITEGGALFQVGPEVNTNLQVNIGVQSMAASRLGNTDLGFLSQVQSDGDYSLIRGEYGQAQKIVKEAIRQVSVLRGRLGAFERNTLDANVSQLGITMENLMAAESSIRDADFAVETANLTRSQVLVASGGAVLAIANQTPQMVLQLLG